MGKQISRCADNTRRLQKTTECCRRVRECIKESLITYLDSWEYWCVAWRGPEHGNSDKKISVDMRKDYKTWISQKIQKRKVLEELVPLQLGYSKNYTTLVLNYVLKNYKMNAIKYS